MRYGKNSITWLRSQKSWVSHKREPCFGFFKNGLSCFRIYLPYKYTEKEQFNLSSSWRTSLFSSDINTDVRYAILDLWSLLPSREATRHANEVLAACSILRLFVVLFKKAYLSNAIWSNNKGLNPIYLVHRSDIPFRGPWNMLDARLSRPNASLNSLSVYFSNVKQLDLILISC